MHRLDPPPGFDGAFHRQLRRSELDDVLDWAAGEGWNPGLADAEAFWATDPNGYLGVEMGGRLIASGSTIAYGGRLGFMGLFIVRPELRHRGLGERFWHLRRDLLRERLEPGAAIGMDGVFEMQPFYARGGFELSHRNLRMAGKAERYEPDSSLRPLSELRIADVAGFDRAHFGVARDGFLRRWIAPDGGLGLGLHEDGRLHGIGVIRPSRQGFKVGPLFADNEDVAERIFRGLSRAAPGQPISLDVPELNAAAVALARRHGLEETFGCARMYLGRPPELPWERIFGVTTFELG